MTGHNEPQDFYSRSCFDDDFLDEIFRLLAERGKALRQKHGEGNLRDKKIDVSEMGNYSWNLSQENKGED